MGYPSGLNWCTHTQTAEPREVESLVPVGNVLISQLSKGLRAADPVTGWQTVTHWKRTDENAYAQSATIWPTGPTRARFQIIQVEIIRNEQQLKTQKGKQISK